LHVLVTGALVALIAATLLRISVMRTAVSARSGKALQERRYDEAGLNAIISNWNAVNTVCANNVPNYSCSPASGSPPGSCGCTCTPSIANFPTITAGGNPCALTIVSTDLP